jgi:hypothetical protein
VAEAHELHLQLSLLAAKPPHHYALAGCDLPMHTTNASAPFFWHVITPNCAVRIGLEEMEANIGA